MFDQIQILGDYNSATKYLHNMLEANYNIKVSSGNLVHKHQYFPIDMVTKHPNTLFLIVHRNFLRWVKSCFRSPHLLKTPTGLISTMNHRTLNEMFTWKIGYTNEQGYGNEDAKKYYKTLESPTWYDNMMNYRNKKTKFYLELLKHKNVIAINDVYLMSNDRNKLLLRKLADDYKLKRKKDEKISKFVFNGTQYLITKNVMKIINKELNSRNEKILNEKSIKIG